MKRFLIQLPAINAKFSWDSKAKRKTSLTKTSSLREKGKLYGDRLRLNRQRRRLYNWKASPSSFSWVSFLGCLQQCSVLFIKTTYSREPWHCGVQREERIVHAFAWFRNWLHQNNAPCLISLFNKNTDVNVNSITGTPVLQLISVLCIHPDF